MIDMNCTDSDDDDSSYDPNSGTLFGTDDGS